MNCFNAWTSLTSTSVNEKLILNIANWLLSWITEDICFLLCTSHGFSGVPTLE